MRETDGRVRVAAPADRDVLVGLMAEFYAESTEPFDAERSAEAFGRILGDDALGRVWLFEIGEEAAGYVVMTLGFSMEYSGRDAFVDDLFVRAPYRRRGLGSEAMTVVMEECRRRDVLALHLEVDRRNLAAKELYRQYGFRDKERQLLTADLRSDQQTERTQE